MNLPNKLTVFRILLVPLLVILLMAGPECRIWAFSVFVVASVTDTLDGNIARKYNLVTDFGKIMDPLADKILVLATLVCLCQLGEIPGWTIIIILFREFLVSGMRIVAAAEGNVIAAGVSGKIKTTLQVIAIGFILIHDWPVSLFSNFPLGMILYYASVAACVYSGTEYVLKNKNVFLKKGI